MSLHHINLHRVARALNDAEMMAAYRAEHDEERPSLTRKEAWQRAAFWWCVIACAFAVFYFGAQLLRGWLS